MRELEPSEEGFSSLRAEPATPMAPSSEGGTPALSPSLWSRKHRPQAPESALPAAQEHSLPSVHVD